MNRHCHRRDRNALGPGRCDRQGRYQPTLECSHNSMLYRAPLWQTRGWRHMLRGIYFWAPFQLLERGFRIMRMDARQKLIRRLTRAPIILEAFCLLAVAKAALVLLPFRWIQHTISQPGRPSVVDSQDRITRNVCSAVRVTARRLAPWAVCLPQALAGHWMLRRRGIASVVCFGVRREPGMSMEAHAWLRALDTVVLGQEVMTEFKPVAQFPLA
jgi:hypothetical protein